MNTQTLNDNIKLLKSFNMPNGYQEQMYEYSSTYYRDNHIYEMVQKGWEVAHFEKSYAIYTAGKQLI